MSEIAKTDSSIPSYLQQYEGDLAPGQEALSEYTSLQYLKIVADMSKELKKEGFREGTVLLMPAKEVIAEPGDSFTFVPLFFYPQAELRNPIACEPFVLERTIESTSELMLRARSRNPEERTIQSPTHPDKIATYTELMCFVIQITSGPCEGSICIATFSKGEFKTGKALATLIRQRGARIPMFAMQFTAKCGEHRNTEHTWWGLNFNNPQEPAERWSPEGKMPEYKEIATGFADLLAEGMLLAKDADTDSDYSPSSSVDEDSPLHNI